MESLILFLVVFLLAAPVALVLAILALRRLGRLEKEVIRLSCLQRETGIREAAPAPEVRAEAPAPEPAPAPQVDAPPAPRPVAAPARPTVDLEAILGGQWLTWTGILALFFGSAFFLGVDLGESVLAGLPQLMIGLAVAAVFNVVGRYWSVRRERILGLGLLGGGVALLYLAAYASYGFHHLVPAWVVFPMLIVVAVVGAWLALDRNSLTIASLTLVGALLTPVLVEGDDTAYTLLPYLAVVNLGAVLVGLRRGWAGLSLGAFATTAILVLFWCDAHYETGLRVFALVCVTAIWALYGIAPWLRRTTTHRFWSFARAVMLAGNGLLFAVFCHHLLEPDLVDLQGAVLLVLAVVYVLTSRRMRRSKGEDEATRLTYLTGVALALVAIPVQLSLAWITFGWTVLAAVLLIAGLRERDRWQRFAGLAVLGLVLMRSVLADMPFVEARVTHFRPVLNSEFLVGLALLVLLGWLFWAYDRWSDRLSETERKLRTPFMLAGVGIFAWKLTGEFIGYFAWREQTLGIDQLIPGLLYTMLLWAVYGFVTIAAGLRFGRRSLRVLGAKLLVGAVAITTGQTVITGADPQDGYRLLLNLPFLQGVALAFLLAGTYRITSGRRDDLVPAELWLRTPFLLAAILLLFLKVSFEVVGYFLSRGGPPTPDLALQSTLTLSLVWALYAGAVVVAGFVARFKPVRVLGISLVGLTVVKVFLMDIQALDQGYRIAAFVALGVVLLAISLLYQRKREEQRS
ncbi:MAG: DUF2339 domain-containing protein [bacterium]|nr:DUF2339 domain-containing protein [bacterium]